MAKFKTSARTVDMLGRQQIAGIPTAINELFKNAHDAYAKYVEVDYIRSNNLFVLRDDGLGMTLEDFETRWLTLGTESKLGAKTGIAPPPSDPTQKERPILGEKGIGRLAIASIGSQVLVLTRAKSDDKLHDLVVAYIHWGIFECPGITLEDVDIPLRTISSGELPSKSIINSMLIEFGGNITRLHRFIDAKKANEILHDTEMLHIDLVPIYESLGGPSLIGEGYGTHFFIRPASELLKADIDEPDPEKAPPLQKALLGFTNTMTPDHTEPVIKAAFRDHRTDDMIEDLIVEGAFFTPDEFRNADHHISGIFDKHGQFKGTVAVYGEEYREHIVPWKDGGGLPTLCGSFKINVASVQGASSESTIPLEEWGRLVNKMNRYGGLYIYKDGIRILPYGDTDFDWLDIEKNRTKSAGYYYFSYRRIFGVVEINQKDNSRLKEKAGREGFIENQAYRQLKSILKNFFVQLAADFFRKESTSGERFIQRKEELNRLEMARRKREQLVSSRKKTLSLDLAEFFKQHDAGKPQEDALAITEDIAMQLSQASKINDPTVAADTFLKIESTARQRVSDLQAHYRVIRPRGIGLSRAQERDWNSYENAYNKLQSSVFVPAMNLVEDLISSEVEKAKIELDRRIRIEKALDDISVEAKKVTRTESNEARDTLTTVGKEIAEAIRERLAHMESITREVMAEFARLDISKMADSAIVEVKNEFENRIIGTKEKEQKFFQNIRAQLDDIDLSENSERLDLMEALEQRTIALEEQAEIDLQLSQLGMAIEVINHEFNQSVRSIRNGLKRLGDWADLNQDLKGLYSSLRTSFDHLDGYLTLLTPLDRRLHRNKVEISGKNISDFMQELFSERLVKDNIALLPTKAFLNKTITEYPSSIYPVFINLIDNALYWLKDQPIPRTVTLDADSQSLIISDNGPGIAERDREAIFEMGFTRKPGGKGMGLYISREVLKKIGYKLILDENISQRGTTFRIQPDDLEEESNENGE
jgi:signal transduction histidine kinase